jgi:hypothetical protein
VECDLLLQEVEGGHPHDSVDVGCHYAGILVVEQPIRTMP